MSICIGSFLNIKVYLVEMSIPEMTFQASREMRHLSPTKLWFSIRHKNKTKQNKGKGVFRQDYAKTLSSRSEILF